MSKFQDKLGYVRSLIITAPLIFLYTGVMGTISLISSLVDSNGRIQHACARFWSRLILWTSSVRLKVSGLENLKPGQTYVLCANHQSHMDIPIMLLALPFQFRFASKKEWFGVPFLGWHLRRSGHVSIDRENPRAAIASLRKAAETIRGGMPVLIFPEGGTSRDGTIKGFKGGGFMMATRSGASAVPITITGSRRILVPKTYYVHSGVVEVKIGIPVRPEGLSNSDLAKRVRDDIVAAFYGSSETNEEAVYRNSDPISREI